MARYELTPINWNRSKECDLEDLGYGLISMADAEARQDSIIAKGSVLADIGACGQDNLPCGVCVVCEEQYSSF